MARCTYRLEQIQPFLAHLRPPSASTYLSDVSASKEVYLLESSARYNHPVIIDIAEDGIPRLVRSLEHYRAYLEATKRLDKRYLAVVEELKRKLPAARRTAGEAQLSAGRGFYRGSLSANGHRNLKQSKLDDILHVGAPSLDSVR